MKIVGLLSWYDEDPLWLEQAATSAFLLCDEVIALDGPYMAFPGVTAATSPPEQQEALSRAGARVTLVAGPVSLPTPGGVTRIDVETAQQMADAVMNALPADAAILVAAVANPTNNQKIVTAW